MPALPASTPWCPSPRSLRRPPPPTRPPCWQRRRPRPPMCRVSCGRRQGLGLGWKVERPATCCSSPHPALYCCPYRTYRRGRQGQRGAVPALHGQGAGEGRGVRRRRARAAHQDEREANVGCAAACLLCIVGAVRTPWSLRAALCSVLGLRAFLNPLQLGLPTVCRHR